MAQYTVTYEVNSKPFPANGSLIWAVEGIVKDEQGNIVCRDDLTGRCWDEAWVRRVYAETFERWNSDPKFNQQKSGDRWRDKILP